MRPVFNNQRVARLTAYRAANGWSQRELADKAGISPQTLCYIERGQRRPHRSTQRAIAAALEVPTEALFPPDEARLSSDGS